MSITLEIPESTLARMQNVIRDIAEAEVPLTQSEYTECINSVLRAAISRGLADIEKRLKASSVRAAL